MRILLGLASVAMIVTGIVIAGCDDQTLSRPSPADPRIDSDEDAGTATDGSVPGTYTDSGCPKARVLKPTDLGPGFLPPEKVTLVRSVDGDTAHFRFPSAGEQTCRFLWVDTEESVGDERTAFGVQTKDVVAGYLKTAKDIVVAVHEAPGSPGQPELDQFGRWLSLIFVDGDLFETRLMREGWAPYYTQFGCAPEPVHVTLLQAEAEARAAARGIWEPNHPLDYEASVNRWMGRKPWCRPNPFQTTYCK